MTVVFLIGVSIGVFLGGTFGVWFTLDWVARHKEET